MTEQQALLRLTALCSASEHCEGEMIDKLRQWELTPEEQARIMHHLVSQRYVDDARYTRAFALDKIRYNGWGRKKIEQALFLKHVDTNISKPVLDEIDEEEYITVLRPLLTSKLKTIKARNAYELRGKLFRFALGRGFLYQQIDGIANELITCSDDSEI